MKQKQRTKMSGPMLYIQQPHMKPPKIKMQEHYKGKEISGRLIEDGNEVQKLNKSDLVKERDNKGLIEELNVNRGIDQNEPQITKLEYFMEQMTAENLETVTGEIAPTGIEVKQKNETGILLEDCQLEVSDDALNQDYSMLQEQPELINDEIKQNKVTPFYLLSLEEKLRHLKRVPGSVAKIRYEFVTTERVYSGYFLSLHDDYLIIEFPNNWNKIRIKKDMLVNILLKGL